MSRDKPSLFLYLILAFFHSWWGLYSYLQTASCILESDMFGLLSLNQIRLKVVSWSKWWWWSILISYLESLYPKARVKIQILVFRFWVAFHWCTLEGRRWLKGSGSSRSWEAWMEWSSRHLILTKPSSGYGRHLGGEFVDGRSLSHFQENKYFNWKNR